MQPPSSLAQCIFPRKLDVFCLKKEQTRKLIVFCLKKKTQCILSQKVQKRKLNVFCLKKSKKKTTADCVKKHSEVPRIERKSKQPKCILSVVVIQAPIEKFDYFLFSETEKTV